MAQQPLFLLTGVDVRRATMSGTSRANIIDKLTIPAIKRQVAAHNPGGGIMEVDYHLNRIEKLEPAFSIKGIDTDVFRGLGETDIWTLAGAYRDKSRNRDVPARVILEAAITSWEPDQSDPKEFQGCNHMFGEVTHFEFILDGIERLYFDAEEIEARVDGVSLFAGYKGALGI